MSLWKGVAIGGSMKITAVTPGYCKNDRCPRYTMEYLLGNLTLVSRIVLLQSGRYPRPELDVLNLTEQSSY